MSPETTLPSGVVPDLFRAAPDFVEAVMTGFLKLISAILWVLNYVRQNPKKSVVGATGLAGVTTAAMFYGSPGVPTSPPFYVGGTMEDGKVPTVQADDVTVEWEAGGGGGGASDLVDLGDITNVETATDGHVLTANGDDTFTFEEVVGGSGLTYEGTIGDGQFGTYDDTDNVYIPTPGGTQVQNVKNFIGGKRAAGTSAQTTADATGANPVIAATSASTWARGHGAVLVGGGADHGLSAPANGFVFPRTAYPATLGSTVHSAIPFTASTSTERISLPATITAGRATLRIPDGQGVRFSNQGGGLPTYATTTAFTENSTTYYLRNAPESMTVAISGTPTAGTYTLFDEYTGNSCTVAYNASSATLQAALRLMPGWAQVTVSEAGSTPNFTHTITCTGVPGDALLIYDQALLTGGTPVIAITQVTQGGWTVHPTAADAIANTNAYDIDGAGTGTHYIAVYGDRTYEYQAKAGSGNGGWTAANSAFQTTTGAHELSRYTHNMVLFDAVATAEGYLVYGDGTSNKKLLCPLNALRSYYKITLQAGGYTSPEIGDIGRSVSDGTLTGTLIAFDATNRILWVDRGSATSMGSNGATITITGGTGGGTQTGATTNACAWIDWGNDKDENLGVSYNFDKYIWYPRIQRRCGEQCYPGQLMEYGGNFYVCDDVYPVEVQNAANDRRTTAPVAFTINTTTNVVTTASATGMTTGTGFHMAATVALPTHTATTRFPENTMVYWRVATTTTGTIHPTALDATNNTNAYDLIADGVGTMYVLLTPTFDTDINDYTLDDRVLWRRVNQTYPVSPSASPIFDGHWSIVESVSSNNITLADAPTTSVTGGLLMHDDTDALQAHFEVAKASGSVATKMYLPSGKYPVVLKKGADDTRLFTEPFGSGLVRYVFRWTRGDRSFIDCEWVGDPDTVLELSPMDWQHEINGTAAGSPIYLWSFGQCKPVSRNIEYRLSCRAEPVGQHRNGETQSRMYGLDTSGTTGSSARIEGPTFIGGGIVGFPLLFSDEWSSSELTGPRFEDFRFFYGASNHDPGAYANGGQWIRVQGYGIGPERSQMFYQDYEDGIPLKLTDCYFEGAMKDGIAIRSHGFQSTRCKYVDCTKVFSRENLNGFSMLGDTLIDTNIIPHNTSNWSQDVSLSGLKLFNSLIETAGGTINSTISDVKITQSGKWKKYSGSPQLANLLATNQTIDNLVIDNRGYSTYDMRGLRIGSTAGLIKVTNSSTIRSEGTWSTLSTAGSGTIWMDNCDFWTQASSSTAVLTQHTGEFVARNCKFRGVATATYDWASGGRTTFENCSNESGSTMTFSAGITGPTYIRRNQWLGNVNYTEPSMVIEDNNSAAAPGLAGATQFTSGNSVADAKSVSATALAASQNNYALPVTDTVILTTSGTNNYSITGFAARAAGTRVVIVNGDATDTITLEHADGASSAANQIRGTGGADVVLGPGESAEMDYANSLWQATEK